jgi:nucleoside-diphosphate-sugar epimerase
MLRPSAFMDIWVDQLIAGDIRKKGKATIFGDGTRVANYVAADDVAEFAQKILAREEIVNEAIDIGGPSNVSLNHIATLVERRLGSSGKRRHLPVAAMKLLRPLVKPFNEVGARMVSLGLYAATQSTAFPGWKASADRFGVSPRTIEQYVETLDSRS